MKDTADFIQLLKLLDESEQLVGQYTGGYSDHYFSAEEFHKALKDTINDLKNGNLDKLNNLFLWFSPSYDWDDFTLGKGEALGNKIYGLLIKLRKQL